MPRRGMLQNQLKTKTRLTVTEPSRETATHVAPDGRVGCTPLGHLDENAAMIQKQFANGQHFET
jgi:hypothetical protein